MQCGSCKSISEHPFKKLYDDGFNVTINTDNRLMSNITMSQEVNKLVETFTFTQEEILQITKNTIEAGFVNSKKELNYLVLFNQYSDNRIKCNFNHCF